ncbi:hypothetical protein GOB87_09925 [Acetobacter estunensis]|uniref:Lipoprotein n=1 Tax=Acetobacter estunensis TaxID=104097 RepID=A0A967B7Q9_9PROT|nr:hypothetical protein [Acetobacter estunensis]NHO54270.1 hypothetical protein [Acetobacter estunensis]
MPHRNISRLLAVLAVILLSGCADRHHRHWQDERSGYRADNYGYPNTGQWPVPGAIGPGGRYGQRPDDYR